MKLITLICGLIGALVGAGVWYFLETGEPPRDARWAPLLIGALAGIGARLTAQASSLATVRGALIAVIALAAMFGTQQAITYGLEKKGEQITADFKAPAENRTMADPDQTNDLADDTDDDEADETETDAAAADESDAEDSGSDDSETAADSDMPNPVAADDPVQRAAEMMSDLQKPLGDDQDGEVLPPSDELYWTAGYFIVGALLAYLLGKGPSLKRSPPLTVDDAAAA